MSFWDFFLGYGWDEGLSQHRCWGHEAWLSRWRIGPGRLVLRDEKLTGTRVYGSKLSYARFERCDLSRMRLSFVDLRKAELIGCTVEDGQNGDAHFDGATIEGCSFDRSVLHRACFKGANVCGGSFAEAGLYYSEWASAKVAKVSFHGAHMGRADLTGAHFVDCDFGGADLQTEALGGWASARFERCDFRSAKLEAQQRAEAVFLDCTFADPTGGYR